MPVRQHDMTLGRDAEDAALRHLQANGLKLVRRNFQPPGKGMADLDLVMQARDGTLVFVEVRAHTSTRFGGAAASISVQKKRRLIQAARYFLIAYAPCPPVRFDVVAFDIESVRDGTTDWQKVRPIWIQSAFEVRDNG